MQWNISEMDFWKIFVLKISALKNSYSMFHQKKKKIKKYACLF